MRSLLARLAALGALAAVVSGCSTSSSPAPTQGVTSGGAGGTAVTSALSQPTYLRVVHGNSNPAFAGGIWVCLDQTTLGGGPIAYKGTATTTVQAGPHVISLYPATSSTSPCVTAPQGSPSIVNVTTAVAASGAARYDVVIGGTSTKPTYYGFLDNITATTPANVPLALFHNAAASIPGATPAPAPTPTGTPGPSQATLQYAPTGGTAGSIATAVAPGTGTATSIPPASIAFTTVNPVPLNSSLQGAGAYNLINPNAAGGPATVATTTSGGNTAPITSIFALDAAGGTQTLLVVTNDPPYQYPLY